MAALKSNLLPHHAKTDRTIPGAIPSPLARVMQEYDDLVTGYETGLLRSLELAEDTQTQSRQEAEAILGPSSRRREEARQHACHLAITELSTTYARKQIRRSLTAAESLGKSAEDYLHTAADANLDAESHLDNIHDGYFRLYSPELFDLLGQPTDMRFGTLRFQSAPISPLDASARGTESTTLEMALNSSFFVADSAEILPFHTFMMPEVPSLRNRGILCRKPEEHGAFPSYDSWLLFTFLGKGCLKIEIPIELCADVYGGPLRGRENDEIVFWGIFVEDETDW